MAAILFFTKVCNNPPVKKTILTKIILGTIGAIPLNIRKGFFIVLARLFYHLLPRQRLIAIHNLTCAFPEMSMPEILSLTRRIYRHLAITAAEFFQIPVLQKVDPSVIASVEGLEHCTRAREKNKGLLFMSAHFGNWEYGAALIDQLVQPIMVIYRPFDSAILENLIGWVRASTGNTPLPKEWATMKIFRSLRKNEIIGILVDQNVAWEEGVFVDFFGRSACTTDGLALLALNTEAPVIPTFMFQENDGRYRLIIGKEVEIIRTGNMHADIVANTQKSTKIAEYMIRKYPDQWLWMHQRWKTKTCQVE